MFVKRMAELKLLEEQYALPGNNLIILYGRKGMGKTTLLAEFLEEKPSSYYYEGTECDDLLQLQQMNLQVRSYDRNQEVYEYSTLFSDIIGIRQEKTIIILDEFHYIMKNSQNFTKALGLLGTINRPVMFVLCSSSIRWVENEMIEGLGTIASYITSYLKLKEFNFVDFVNRFPKSSVETCIHINAILGGVPAYLDEWRQGVTVEENIKNLILNKNSRLFSEPQQFLKLELREPAVYNTILYALARGNRKLNDLHAKTGFSRAKISVYLKNLIQLDLVEKLVPLNDEGRDNVQKGLYRIKDNFLSFWYRFVFPNTSALMLGKTDEIYENKIEPFMNDYMGEFFADVCTEFLRLMNLHNRLPEKFQWWDRWYGKNGTIDILAQAESGKTLVGKCIWEDRETDIKDYETLISLALEAGKTPDYCYLFSKGGVTLELQNSITGRSDVILVGLNDL